MSHTGEIRPVAERVMTGLRDYVQDDSLILEHHSNLLQPKDGEQLDELELLTETWEAPIIITALVQLLNGKDLVLFSLSAAMCVQKLIFLLFMCGTV